MVPLEKPANEFERLKALERYQILDTPADGTFDRITALASSIFKVPIAIISLVDSDRIWFKSHYGLSVNQIGRDPGLCASAILSDKLYIIENAKGDPRCLTNPLVAGEFGLAFYAASPLTTEDNYNLGTLCIIDKKPRVFTEDEKKILRQLADMVMDEMNLRLAVRETTRNIKNISSDIILHLKNTIKKVESSSGTGDVISYLNASRIYLENMQSRMNEV